MTSKYGTKTLLMHIFRNNHSKYQSTSNETPSFTYHTTTTSSYWRPYTYFPNHLAHGFTRTTTSSQKALLLTRSDDDMSFHYNNEKSLDGRLAVYVDDTLATGLTSFKTLTFESTSNQNTVDSHLSYSNASKHERSQHSFLLRTT